ncbi:Dehydrogenase/reductase SDR family member on chromosome X [Teratosphaeria destructans]|uniref:Dehydrogenase/reductase SDR family member on chromosome X n=1 Tax=Teratosphaeria destructans TaxID=418781 RepID=A0A9W7SV83_9PEZI|nr:Dehydrogenase/reductase SDR family member on chromosome X [Teratosphaeria destructans]
MKSWHLFGNPPADTSTPTSSSTCHQIADDTTTGSWRARALDQGNQVLDRDNRDADTDTDTAADADADDHGVSVPIDNNGSLVSDILYGANIEMVKIESVRAANAQGASTARELFVRTTKPKAYIIGRSRDKGDKLVEDLRELNPEAEAIFLEKDISLIKNVDDVCEELLEKEDKINCLFLTAGYMTLKGRTETVEGMDRKMCVNYYSRIRWIQNLMPLLEAASKQNELSRVISVLAAGSEGDVRQDDLDLKRNFTLHACLAHCVVMTDFALEELAQRHPGTSFSHSYPGTVKTGIVNELSGPSASPSKSCTPS